MPEYDKKKTTQINQKPTRKVVATSWANAIILLVIMLTGYDLEPGIVDNLKEILASVLIAGGGGLATLVVGWFKKPSRGDQVN